MPAVVIDGSAADTLLGKPVQSAAGDDMGRIVDVIVDRGGMMRAAIIDFGGFLGVGSRQIAVDWRVLHFAQNGGMDKIIADLSQDQLRVAPVYKPGEPVVVVGRPEVVPAPPAPTQVPAAPPAVGQAPAAPVVPAPATPAPAAPATATPAPAAPAPVSTVPAVPAPAPAPVVPVAPPAPAAVMPAAPTPVPPVPAAPTPAVPAPASPPPSSTAPTTPPSGTSAPAQKP